MLGQWQGVVRDIIRFSAAGSLLRSRFFGKTIVQTVQTMARSLESKATAQEEKCA